MWLGEIKNNKVINDIGLFEIKIRNIKTIKSVTWQKQEMYKAENAVQRNKNLSIYIYFFIIYIFQCRL